MIEETTKYSCRSCGSPHIIGNGRNRARNKQYHCKPCGAYRVLRPIERYSDQRKAQIVAFALGDCSETTAQKLWQTVPKGSGQTNHQERGYNPLRQWIGRYTRRSLSFSKEDRYHELVTRWFMLQHNLMIQQASLTL